MPKLSVIVPIYNVEEYLANCIESILNQTFKDFELILINDGSTDNSLEICYRYRDRDKRINVINKKNGGVSSARNIGIEISKGEYIAFVDPDDDIEINMYEELMGIMENNNVDIVVSGFKFINLINNTSEKFNIYNRTNRIIKRKEINNEILIDILNLDNCYGYGMYSCWNKIYKKELFFKYNIRFDDNKNNGEDAKLNLIMLTVINSIYFLDIPLYNYYIRKRESLTQMVREDTYKDILDNRDFHEYLCNLYGNSQLCKNGIKKYLNDTIRYMNLVSVSNFQLGKKNKILKEILNDYTFKKSINKYECQHRFYVLLKLACKCKLSLIYIFLIKLLEFKEKVDLIKKIN